MCFYKLFLYFVPQIIGDLNRIDYGNEFVN